jgi:hypothetical protein
MCRPQRHAKRDFGDEQIVAAQFQHLWKLIHLR